MGVAVVGSIVTFLAVSLIKWTFTSVLAFLAGIPGRFERWLNRPQGLL